MPWEVAATANAIIAVAYVMISLAILSPLLREGQLRSNPLGSATAMIFFTCAVHHGTHTIHLVAPTLGFDETAGNALREAFASWHVGIWDGVSALVAVWYWTLRKSYGPLMRGAKLFEDMKERQRQALEINDNIVQGLAVITSALALGQQELAQSAADRTIAAARTIITDLLGDASMPIAPGSLRRESAVHQ